MVGSRGRQEEQDKKSGEIVGTGKGMAERVKDVKEDTSKSGGGMRGEQSPLRLPGPGLV